MEDFMKHFTVLFLMTLLAYSVLTYSQVPNKISYQGLLTTSAGTPVVDGSYNLQFDIYNLLTGGTLRHTETLTGVALSKGSFSVILHPPTTIFAESLFVEVTALSGPGISGSITFSPRCILTSAPYSLAPWTTSGSNIFYMNGNVGIGTASPNDQLEITGNLRLPATTATTGIIKVGADRFIHNYGTGNTFIGLNAGNLTMSGLSNTSNGYLSLFSNTTGNDNTAIGSYALSSNTDGMSNTAIGSAAFFSNSSGSDNTAVGRFSLTSNTVGSRNTAYGTNSLLSNAGGSNITALGYGAMWYANNNTTPFTSYNVAVGYEALRGSTTPSANTGNYNTALGYQTLWSNTTGRYNTATGDRSLYTNTIGSYNTANGQAALNQNDIGGSNTAIGYYALFANTDGYGNTAAGEHALSSNGSGYNNTALGASADVNGGNLNNATAIGAYAVVSQSNSLVLGSIAGLHGAGNTVKVGIGTPTPNTHLDLGGDLSLRRNPNPVAWNPGGFNYSFNFGEYSFVQVLGGGGILGGIANGTDGKVLIIYCANGGLTITNNDANALPQNQIHTMSNAAINIVDEGSVTLIYNTNNQKWIVTAFMP
jgi:hypothetical protein